MVVKQPYASDSSGAVKAKLPAWPEMWTYLDPVYPQYFHSPQSEASYYEELSEAALARMEDLAAEVEQLRDEFLIGNPRHAEWLDIINGKLAACARKEAGR